MQPEAIKATIRTSYLTKGAKDMPKRMIETNVTEEDIKIEGSLRPQKLDDYIGQSKVRKI